MRTPSNITEQDCWQQPQLTVETGSQQSAVPITACGLRMSDEAVRVTVGLRLGTELGQARQCICGETVDTRGSHAF